MLSIRELVWTVSLRNTLFRLELLNLKMHRPFVTLFFHLVLICVSLKSWNNLMNEHKIFDEKIVENEAQLPSFTLCPTEPEDPISNGSIENFEDIQKAIEKTIINTEHKPYEEFKIVEEKYNGTSNGVWYFAPKISTDFPFQAVTCLIWTPSRNFKLKPDWSVSVSCFIRTCSF